MPKRMTRVQHQRFMGMIIRRDGDRCLLCGKMRFRPQERTIDHMDNNPRNNDLDNLHLLCRPCNTGENNRRKSGKSRLLRADTLTKYLNSLPQIDLSSNQVPLSLSLSTSPQVPRNRKESVLTVSNKLMPVYRYWVFQQVKEKGFISSEDAINGGAGHLYNTLRNGHPKTVKSYFAMITGVSGFLVEGLGSSREQVWTFPPDLDFKTLGHKLRKEAEGK